MKLPIEDALPDLRAALRERPNAVLVAPPGAGKTTRVPLALLAEPWCTGRIVMLEPRRIAARAAAERMAATLGERVGETVGLRVRLETKVSSATRIEVVTEGVFTRAILSDPELEGVDCVIFDEFHERSLDADLGLALALDAQGSLRPELRILPMSATLDGARVAAVMDARVIESSGRAHPVETVHDPRHPDERVERHVARAVREALAAHEGSVLVFLPGQREIMAAVRAIGDVGVPVHPLYGALPPTAQDAAIRAGEGRADGRDGGRKVVVASAIAESSLTIPGVRQVIDSGLARRPVFDPATGLTRLATVRASRASVDQRRGRAGREAPGRCVRLWHEGQTAALEPFDPPEILAADLAALALDLADWGVGDAGDLRWLDPPPAPALAEARALLVRLGCLDGEGRVTAHGREVAARPLPPRLSHMVVTSDAPAFAARAALLTQERGLGGEDVDLARRMERFRRDRSGRAGALHRLADRIAKGLPVRSEEALGTCLARAYPDRIAERRGAANGMRRFRMANGAGVEVDEAHALAAEPLLVVVDCAGAAGRARILSAAALDRETVDEEALTPVREVSVEGGRVRARERRMLGAIVWDERRAEPTDAEAWDALREAMERDGLPLDNGAHALLARLRVLDPALDEASLAAGTDEWLAPFVPGARSLSEVAGALRAALLARTGHDARSLDRALPPRWTAPSGREVAVSYREDGPRVEVKPQELFGLDAHPQVSGRPLVLVLVSPARRPVQTTADLPRFWRTSWGDVRADMRGRYPKHDWPERPWEAVPSGGVRRR